MSSGLELARGFVMPVKIYPTFENAIRAHRGESQSDHLVRISELWEGFNRVAVDNPYAWVRRPMTAGADPHPERPTTGWSGTRTRSS